MASTSRSRSTTDGRSGGKILKRRRFSSFAKTPYDRPTANPPPPPQNPNWLTGLLFPATRKIATGAGQLISFIFSDDNFSSSSSDTDCCSEDDVDVGYTGGDMPSDEPAGSKKNNGISSEMIKCSGEDPQPTKGKSSTKQYIEQLLIQETYSREECDRLIKIISSRVVDFPTRIGGQDARQETPDIRNKALAEAKKWLEEKKVGSSSKSDLDHTARAFNSVVLPHQGSDGELGSPVDLAKSYMQRRPPWASPRHMESRTPTPMLIDLFDEGTPYSVISSSSLAQKKDSLEAGSWNIREEIRRVRSKATENVLRTLPSAKNDLSSFPLEPKSIQYTFMEDNKAVCPSDKIYESNSIAAVKPIDASLTLSEGLIPRGFPDDSVLETTHNDGTKNEALSNVVPEAKQIGEEGGDVSKSRHSSPELLPSIDPRSSDGNACTTKEMVEIISTPNAESNGLASTKFSLSAGMVGVEENPDEPNTENPNRASTEHDDKSTGNVGVEETCELLSEASMEVPDVNETDNSIVSGSAPHEEMKILEESTTVVLVEEEESVVGIKTPRRTAVEKQQQDRKKPGRVLRKGNRGRGK